MKDAKNRNLHRFVHFFPIRTNLLILEAGFHQIQWEDAWYTNYSSNTTVYDFWKQTENKWSNMLWDLDRLENRTRFNWKYNKILFSNNNLRELFGLWSLNGWCCFRCHFESGCCIRKQKHRNVYLKAQINEMTLNNNKIHVLNPPRYDIVNGSVGWSAQHNLSNAKKLEHFFQNNWNFGFIAGDYDFFLFSSLNVVRYLKSHFLINVIWCFTVCNPHRKGLIWIFHKKHRHCQ